MRKIDTYELANELQRIEIRNLKDAVRNYGGKVTFQESNDSDATADVMERPCVIYNADNVGPVDVYVNSVELDEDGHLHIRGEYKDDFEEYDIDETDIAVGNITFITDLIPAINPLRVRKLWLRVGICIEAEQYEVENILSKSYPSFTKSDIKNIIRDGHFSIDGLTVIPKESIEAYNSEHGTDFEVKDVKYDF